MPKRKRFQSSTFYHLGNRWRYKNTLFHNKKDFNKFLWYISVHEKKHQQDLCILAYALLPNHFHFVIKNHTFGYRLSDFVRSISAWYAKYYRAKYGWEKWINLFEWRFWHEEIHDADYLDKCIEYVERNAVKHELVNHPSEWIFSSYDIKRKPLEPTLWLIGQTWEFY